jgi:hypothetical protein
VSSINRRAGKMTKHIFVLLFLLAGLALTAPSPAARAEDEQTYDQPQLAQMLAPIALYPDQLLVQIFMAATYPQEVVDAAAWVADPAIAGLKGDDLTTAAEEQDWDPSVKALVVFPQVLQMMADKIEWTQKLGDAFLAQKDAVMDEVQDLRRRARAAGTLQTTDQVKVVETPDAVEIEPAQPETVYVPVYQPAVVYGAWPYPAYEPLYFPPEPGFFVGPVGLGIGFSVGFGVGGFGPLWGLGGFDWGRRGVFINVNNYTIINRGRGGLYGRRGGDAGWHPDPFHRGNIPYRHGHNMATLEGQQKHILHHPANGAVMKPSPGAGGRAGAGAHPPPGGTNPGAGGHPGAGAHGAAGDHPPGGGHPMATGHPAAVPRQAMHREVIPLKVIPPEAIPPQAIRSAAAIQREPTMPPRAATQPRAPTR